MVSGLVSKVRTSLQRVAHASTRWLPELNFITLHYLYFIGTCLLFAIIFWGSSTPSFEVSFTDSLFLCISAMTESGLNTVNLSTLNTWQQFMLFFLTLIGGTPFVSSFVVYLRRRAFEKRFMTELQKDNRLGRRIFKSFTRGRDADDVDLKRTPIVEKPSPMTPDLSKRTSNIPVTNPEKQVQDDDSSAYTEAAAAASSSQADVFLDTTLNNDSMAVLESEQQRPDRITFGGDVRFRPRRLSQDTQSPHRRFNMSGVGARSAASPRRLSIHSLSNPAATIGRSDGRSDGESQNITSSGDESEKHAMLEMAGRNSAFAHLTHKERELLGGTEFKAVEFLSWLVPFYVFIFQFLGCLSLGAFVNNYYASLTRENGLNPWWTGAFNAVSAFNNNGMSLLDANMTPFGRAIFMLLSMSLLILAGNTCFPIFLRFFIWIILKMAPKSGKWNDRRNTLTFLLQHPRRCFTNLFPSDQTWWLLWSVIVLNGIDCVMFVLLNIGNNQITRLSPGYEFIDGLFQALAVRCGGFYVVPIADTRVSLQVLYVIMMYISAFPIAITIRNSNVYEERSLGIYADDPRYDQTTRSRAPSLNGRLAWFKHHLGTTSDTSSRRYFVQQQLRAQLAHDLWWLGLAVFLIMIVEGNQFESNPSVYSVFNVIFETVSAYGTVGLSIGLPNEAYSFCGAWHTLSKLILCAVMLRGRHRGLPVAIDKAVLLPGEHFEPYEEEDARIRQDRATAAGLPLPP